MGHNVAIAFVIGAARHPSQPLCHGGTRHLPIRPEKHFTQHVAVLGVFIYRHRGEEAVLLLVRRVCAELHLRETVTRMPAVLGVVAQNFL